MSEVLEKLSVGFDKYIKILSHMRGEYLDLVQRFSEGEVYHLERAVDESARQEILKAKQDQLLELYSQWKVAPSEEIEESVKRLVGEIQEIIGRLRARGLGILITDHSVRETLRTTDRAYILYEGRIILSGTSHELASDPTARRVYLGERFEL